MGEKLFSFHNIYKRNLATLCRTWSTLTNMYTSHVRGFLTLIDINNIILSEGVPYVVSRYVTEKQILSFKPCIIISKRILQAYAFTLWVWLTWDEFEYSLTTNHLISVNVTCHSDYFFYGFFLVSLQGTIWMSLRWYNFCYSLLWNQSSKYACASSQKVMHYM